MKTHLSDLSRNGGFCRKAFCNALKLRVFSGRRKKKGGSRNEEEKKGRRVVSRYIQI